MSISYSIDRERGVILEVWVGDVTAEDLGAYWARDLADPEAIELRTTLADLRQAVPRFSGQEMADLIRTIVDPILKGRHWTTAVVVDKPLQFGVTRQYQVFAAHYSSDAIFQDCESALAWLAQQP